MVSKRPHYLNSAQSQRNICLNQQLKWSSMWSPRLKKKKKVWKPSKKREKVINDEDLAGHYAVSNSRSSNCWRVALSTRLTPTTDLTLAHSWFWSSLAQSSSTRWDLQKKPPLLKILKVTKTLIMKISSVFYLTLSKYKINNARPSGR